MEVAATKATRVQPEGAASSVRVQPGEGAAGLVGESSVTQPHSLSGLRVVTAGLSVCAVPIMGQSHHCWGGGTPLMWDYDLAVVGCGQLYSTCHCLQQFRQFESGVSIVCMRSDVEGVGDSYGAEGVLSWDAGGGVTGGVNSNGVTTLATTITVVQGSTPVGC